MMCRARIRTGPPPNARLASTNARVRSDSTCPRTMRAIVSHDTAPRLTNKNSTRKAPASAGEFPTQCDCLSISPNVVMSTITKIIVGSE